METDDKLSFWHASHLGTAFCESCNTEWPCHLSAWGQPNRISRCNICGGGVFWKAETPKSNFIDPLIKE